MDIVEFAEMICGRKLPLWQREFLKKIKELPPGSKIVYYNGMFHLLKNNENQKPLSKGEGKQ